MGISKRAMGVEGFVTDAREYPTVKLMLDAAPKEVDNYKLINIDDKIEVKDRKTGKIKVEIDDKFKIEYENSKVFYIKKVRVDEVPQQKKWICDYITKTLRTLNASN